MIKETNRKRVGICASVDLIMLLNPLLKVGKGAYGDALTAKGFSYGYGVKRSELSDIL